VWAEAVCRVSIVSRDKLNERKYEGRLAKHKGGSVLLHVQTGRRQLLDNAAADDWRHLVGLATAENGTLSKEVITRLCYQRVRNKQSLMKFIRTFTAKKTGPK
jgi:hypothetical protein